MNQHLYIDHASTTSVHPAALERYLEVAKIVGNGSSIHWHGRQIRKIIEESREIIASLTGAKANEIIFTSSGTESDNFAIKGFYLKANRPASKQKKPVIITTSFEHHAIEDSAKWLVDYFGANYQQVKVTPSGQVDLNHLAELVDKFGDQIALISIIHANNEIGVIQNLPEIVKIAGQIPVHSDCVQSVGKVPIDFSHFGLAAASFTSHKVGGVNSVAAFYLKHGLDIEPILHGGGQERDLRSGTFNAAGIASFAKALEISVSEMESERSKYLALRKYLFEAIKTIPQVTFNGADDLLLGEESSAHLPHILNCTFADVESEALLMVLDSMKISASAGSACTAGVSRPSHVLLALGLPEERANSSIRFSLGAGIEKSGLDELIAALPLAVEKARTAFKARHH